jgi:hypothetical protein
VTPKPALAAEAACGTFGNYYDGYTKQLSQTYLSWGVSANVTVRSTALCTSITDGRNVSLATTLITPRDADGWAQTGTHRAANGYTRHFSQWKRTAGGPNHTILHYQHLFDGEVHQYWTAYVSSGCPSSGSCLAMRVDATTLDRTSFNPNGEWAGPWRTQYFGESTYHGTDVPGRPTGKVNFANMQHQSSPTTWASQPCGMDIRNSIPERWTNEVYGCPSRAVWTYNP